MYKYLVKSMTYDELIEYLDNHPNYRMLTREESKEIKDIETFRILGESNREYYSMSNNGLVHKLFKLPVVLKKRDISNLKSVGRSYLFEFDSYGRDILFTIKDLDRVLKLYNIDREIKEFLYKLKESDIVEFRYNR